jgi:proline dehydrogenase
MSVSFDNTSVAFAGKSNASLKFSYWLFKVMNSPFWVKALSLLAKIAVVLKLPVKPIIKYTVYRQFCGGESIKECNKVINELGKAGIGSILDYSVEGIDDEEDSEKVKSELLRIIEFSQSNKNIPCVCLKITGIGSFNILEKKSEGASFSEKEEKEYNRIIIRLNELCEAANKAGKQIYIDAEESWIQPAIDDMTENMMKKYNTEKAIVFTTVQMYRKDRLEYFENLITKAKSEQFIPGVKIVRGAYLEKENSKAKEKGMPSPINPNKETTDSLYNESLKLAINNINNIEICAGTHNVNSCVFLTSLMKEKNLPNNYRGIWFSQLYGMSDNISYNLANEGYNVSKYLPYGPVKSTLPYLIRRAQENTAIAGQMGKELKYIIAEIERRKNSNP